MKHSKTIVLTKRDGTAECFVVEKLTGSLARVLQERAYDPRLAGPLARAVAMHLEECTPGKPQTTDYVFKCVCAVLEQTGLADIAGDLKRHRKGRAQRRRRIQVIDVAQAQANVCGRPWRKVAVVATLQNRYGLRLSVARFLASRIESQVFALNYRLITRQFLAELVRNEVLAWGLADTQVFTAQVGLNETPVAPGKSDQQM